MGEPGREESAALRDWVVERVLAPLVPGEWREAFVGDLVEEARRFVVPERGARGARRWLRWQIARSLPGLLWHRTTQAARTIGGRFVVAAQLVGLGMLQGWDSGVQHATPLVIGLVAMALALTALAVLFARRRRWQLVLTLMAPLPLVVARLVSPTSLPDLLTVVPALLIGPLWLGGWLPRWRGRARRA